MNKIFKIIITGILLCSSQTICAWDGESIDQHIIENYIVTNLIPTDDICESVPIEIVEDKKEPEIPEENQLALIALGKQVLRDIISNNPSLITTLTAIENIPPEVKNFSAFHKEGERTPSAWVRWWLVKDDPVQQEYLAKIVSICWALYDLAKSKDEAFPRGSFTIIDPDHRLYTFFFNYVAYVTNCTNPADLAWASTFSNFAYRRDPALMGSSHHRDHTENSQFGIDIRFRSYETVYGFLPHMNRHILFGKLTIPGSLYPLTFFKFEPVGLGSSLEVAAHTLNYTQSGTVEETSRREKDIPDEIISTFDSLAPSRNSKSKKIYEMLKHVNFKINQKSHALFIEILKKHFPRDSEDLFHIRTGNEVILDLRFFLPSSYV